MEFSFINEISAIHRRCPGQVNRVYEADAEIVRHGSQYFLFSLDGFSEREDFFANTPPERTGANMAVAAVCDLLACGVKPLFYTQLWDVSPAQNQDFYRQAAAGVEAVLRRCNAFCLGGDTGRAESWRYAVSVFGIAGQPPVTRVAREKAPFDLYVSGPLGDANAACFLQTAMPEFELRLAEREVIARHALFATDSSDGFLNALENFRRVNPGLSLTLDLSAVPYAETVCDLPVPPEFALIGGCGEYELVFALPQSLRGQVPYARVGEGGFDGSGIRLEANGKRVGSIKSPPPDYRSVEADEYVALTERYHREMMS